MIVSSKRCTSKARSFGTRCGEKNSRERLKKDGCIRSTIWAAFTKCFPLRIKISLTQVDSSEIAYLRKPRATTQSLKRMEMFKWLAKLATGSSKT